MRPDVLDAIRETLREDGVLTEKLVLARYVGDAHRRTIGRGIKDFKAFQEKQIKLLRGDPITGRPVSWELEALRQSQATQEA